MAAGYQVFFFFFLEVFGILLLTVLIDVGSISELCIVDLGYFLTWNIIT